ncbi:MAG: hypothetical protein A2912_05865 [Candidatus Buchananbacteria bacterium RIFCSPLOWO2_01_FULL_40_23b]|uniref:Uncharacterized protein n=1 Tax=Candidatus Buchananbacteria bacterium RIFCSPLOWO2_01_FULL_40_23b TaxID=1797544 RepID=A0A1G1YT58_9BACT|nr:MAG: hypothetical protein A2912_05865 [Candidatus Buchananbacteria bacterium RIFCSPLOWO2_01_FULL_40_23b]
MISPDIIPLRQDILCLLEPHTLLLYKPTAENIYIRAKTTQKLNPQSQEHPIILLTSYNAANQQYHENQSLLATTQQLFFDIPPKGLERRLQQLYEK